MLKNKSKFIAFLAILLLFFSVTFSFADDEETENAVLDSTQNTSTEASTSEEDSYKKKDLYLSGDEVNIDYIVDGNVFIWANTVNINSQIGGDAFIIAKNITIGEKGYVFSNLFALTDSLEVKGVVYNIYTLAKEININKGYVYRDVNSSCGTLNINGTIGRNVFVKCGDINFGTGEDNKGSIYGNLEYTSTKDIKIPDGYVAGEVNFNNANSKAKKFESLFPILLILNFVIFVLIIWLICLWLAPKFFNTTEKYTGKKILPTIGWGLVGLLVIPFISMILCLFILTIKIAVFLLCVYVLALMVSSAITLITLNNYLCSKLKINNKYAICGMLALCSLITSALLFVPYLNIVISICLAIFGFGVLIDKIIPKKSKN